MLLMNDSAGSACFHYLVDPVRCPRFSELSVIITLYTTLLGEMVITE